MQVTETPTTVAASSVVRVLDRAGRVVGAGCLIGPDLVATCAHVIAAALGGDPGDTAPLEPVALQFPVLAHDVPPQRRPTEDLPDLHLARVIRWLPVDVDGGDVALLRLHRVAPHGARVPPVRRQSESTEPAFRVFGFPDGLTDGVWTTGWIRSAPTPTSAPRLEIDDGEPVLTSGFSGTPVWETERRAVVGLARVRPAAAEATMVPIGLALGVDPETLPCPYQGLKPFDEDDAAFFHGRDVQVGRVVDLLARQRLVVVAGSSGTGKSSLLRAGVTPALRRAGTAVGVHRVTGDDEPAVQLRAALSTVPPAPGASGGESDTVIVLDQLEELVGARPDAAAALVRLLVVATKERPRLKFVLTLRWESLENLLSPELSAALSAGTLFLPAMRRGELREAIVGPAAHPPGLDFEPGLVDAILDAAGDEPGQLPHVGALLRLLWHARDGGLLTRSAYDAVGGVSGAVARQADEAVAPLTDEQMRDVRRLVGRLVTIDREGDGFTRRPRRLDEFPAPERALLPALTAARLLVMGTDGSGVTTVELAHQALVDYWPRLRQWLGEDRQFIVWQAEADEQRRRWAQACEDTGALLRGTPLDEALDWQRRRPDEIAAPLRQYVDRSHARRRRDRRRVLQTIAFLTVLLVVAVSLGVVAQSRGNHLSGQLDKANAGTLGRAALAQAVNDPATATQLALLAYRSDPGNPDARAALLDRYAAQRSVETVFPHVTDGSPIHQVQQSDDGRVILVDAVDRSSVVVDRGPTRPPVVWTPDVGPGKSVLSPDGRLAVSADRGGRYTLWDVRARTDRTLLGTDSPRIAGAPLAANFSPNGRFLAVIAEEQLAVDMRLHVWDVSGSEPAEVWSTAVKYYSLDVRNAWPSDDGATVTVRTSAIDKSAVDVWSRDGVRPGGSAKTDDVAIGPGAREVYRCSDDGWASTKPALLTVYDRLTGRQSRQFTLPTGTSCTFEAYSMDGGHLVVDATARAPRTAAAASVVSVATGRTFDITIPTPPDNLPLDVHEVTRPTVDSMISARDEADGALAALVARGDSVYRLRGRPDWIGPNPSVHAGALLSDDGRYLVAFDPGNGIEVRDAATGVRTAVMAPDPAEFTDATLNVGDVEGNALIHLYREKDGPDVHLTVWSLPDLAREADYVLPRSPETGPPETAQVELTPDRIYASVGSGRVLSVFDRHTHREIGQPVGIGPAAGRSPVSEAPGVLVLAPDDPDRVIVTSTDGSTAVWSLGENREVATLPVDPLPGSGQPVFYDTPHRRVLVLDREHLLETVDTTTWRLSARPVPVPDVDEIVGVTQDGDVALRASEARGDETAVRLWDAGTGAPSGTLWLPAGAEPVRQLDGPTLTVDGFDALPAEYTMSSTAWFAALCGTDARALTDREATLLPSGAPKEACRGA